jgi:AcrR family transcriptional regulator
MKRQYDSSRRKKAADKTRNEILQAALKLHWQGITEFEPLAREAGCSVATLRKHFPSKEALFQNCTQTFAKTLTMPDLQALGQITKAADCIQENVSELCRIHEAMFGYAWLSAHQRKDSPTLDSEMTGYEGLTDAIAENITTLNSSKAPLIRGMLDFLTYRALRLSAGLSPEKAREQLTATIHLLILGLEKSPD